MQLQCRECKIDKELTEFNKNSRNKSTQFKDTICKSCAKIKSDAYRYNLKQNLSPSEIDDNDIKFIFVPELNATVKSDLFSCVGRKINKLTVLGFVPKIGSEPLRVNCLCDCGNHTSVACSTLVRSGRPQSCGCIKRTYEENQAVLNFLYSSYRSSAKQRNCGVFDLSKETFTYLIMQECHYCTVKPQERTFNFRDKPILVQYNGIDRKDSTEGYTTSNCVPCCTICNRAKINMPYDVFRDYINRIRTRKEDLT